MRRKLISTLQSYTVNVTQLQTTQCSHAQTLEITDAEELRACLKPSLKRIKSRDERRIY